MKIYKKLSAVFFAVITVLLLTLSLRAPRLFAVGVSAAPEGKAIRTAEDFQKMGNGGIYYLDADIAVDETFSEPFHGYFNGNGHTVTVSAPMFADFSGKVSDLTITGSLTGKRNLAPLALDSGDGIIVLNVVNRANVTVTGLGEDTEEGIMAAGFLVRAIPYSACVFRNCKNYGDITIETDENVNGKPCETFAGGFAAQIDHFDAKMCENHGNVTALGKKAGVAGFCARAVFQKGSGEGRLYIYDCLNRGEIKGSWHAGGFVGNLGVSENFTNEPYEIAYSMNEANVTAGYMAGGFCGYCHAMGADDREYIRIINCISVGDVTAGYMTGETPQNAHASLMVGYSNGFANTIENCLCSGRLISRLGTEVTDPPYLNWFGCSSTTPMNCPMKNNLICDYGTTKWYSYAFKYEKNRIPFEEGEKLGMVTRITEDEVRNGKALEMLNTAANEQVFTQEAGKDPHPLFNPVSREKRAEEYAKDYEESEYGEVEETSTAAPKTTTAAPETTNAATADAAAPETTTDAATADAAAAPEEKKGGCGSAIALGAISGLIPLASILKKKRKK